MRKESIKRKEKQLSSSKQKSISRSELFYYWPKRYFCTRRPAICCQVWYWQDAKFISIFRVGRFQLREEKLSKALRLKTRCDTRARINKLDWNLLLVMPLQEEKLDFAWKNAIKRAKLNDTRWSTGTQGEIKILSRAGMGKPVTCSTTATHPSLDLGQSSQPWSSPSSRHSSKWNERENRFMISAGLHVSAAHSVKFPDSILNLLSDLID